MRIENRNRHFGLSTEKYDSITGYVPEPLNIQEDKRFDFGAIKPTGIHSLISEKVFNSIAI